MKPLNQISLYNKYDSWAIKKFSSQGITEKDLMIKKDGFLANGIALTGIIILLFLAYFLHLKILLYYEITLILLIVGLAIPIYFFKKHIDKIVFVSLMVSCVATLAFMLKLGGLLSSAGLILTGISAVVFSVALQNVKYSAWVAITYILTIIIATVLQPILTIPDEMTAAKNLFLFAFNFIWQTLLILYIVWLYVSVRKKMIEHSLEVNKRLIEIDDLKTKLYTNITHEFRTPLTVIMGMAEEIKENPELRLLDGTEKIKKNSKLLLRLVDQILDYNKLESGMMPVNMVQGDLISHVKVFIDSFQTVAKSKNIKIHFSSNAKAFVTDFDPELIYHILSNLISNAINFSEEGKNITITLEVDTTNKGWYYIKVKDEGIGIKKEALNNLFNRYYRVPDSAKGIKGSGLGLSITHEVVRLLGGEISVESAPKIGTEFTVKLPVSSKAPVQQSEIKRSFEDITLEENRLTPEITDDSNTALPILLIVEDNPDVLDYLKIMLSEKYNLKLAANGKMGLELAFETIPDIILSDVMMPEMDGFEMLQKIKNNIRTSHIPVVILTAKADIQSKITGFEYGADAYISKPFDKQELLVRLEKLIELRKILYERYSSLDTLPKTDSAQLKKEDIFINKFRNLLDANLDNDEFGIHEICEELAISRSQLYRKFKALTDTSVHAYQKSFRLYKARELLKNSDLNISEVAYKVGFKTPSHFSHAFYEEFGINPGSFKSV